MKKYFLLPILFIFILSSCKENVEDTKPPTEKELNEIIYTVEDIEEINAFYSKYAGKTLREVIEVDQKSAGHRTRKTKREHNSECEPFN